MFREAQDTVHQLWFLMRTGCEVFNEGRLQDPPPEPFAVFYYDFTAAIMDA